MVTMLMMLIDSIRAAWRRRRTIGGASISRRPLRSAFIWVDGPMGQRYLVKVEF